MGDSAPGWDLPRQQDQDTGRHRTKWIIAGAVGVTVLAIGAVLLLRDGDSDSPEGAARAEAERFLGAWADGDPEAAAAFTDDPEAAASLLESVQRNLGAEETALTVSGEPARGDLSAGAPEASYAVPFTAAFTLPGLGEWSYESSLYVVRDGPEDEGWHVHWESPLVHPELVDGQTLVLSTDRPERAPILAADGSQLAGPSAVWDLSIWPARLTDPDAAWEALDGLDVGLDTGALADRVEDSDPDQAVSVVSLRDQVFREHEDELRAVEGLQFAEDTRPLAHLARTVVGGIDPATGTGSSGLQGRYEEQLAGTASATVVIADRESGDAVEVLYEQEGGEPGTPVQTTIDAGMQRAAEAALEGTDQAGSIVAVRPSTGEVLAAADSPLDGGDRSLSGQLAPGSTFKVITTAALLESGTAPGEAIGCPKYETVEGYRFQNQNEFELGPDTTLHEAFTASCNTAYIGNRDRFDNDTLRLTAEAFGIGVEWDLGAGSFDGSVPDAEGASDLAASLIGQGRVQASPLVMASVAATVAEGTFHQPVLVPEAVPDPAAAPRELSAETVDALRTMMRDTVTQGTATVLADVPGVAHAKTGTAEFDTGDGELSTNAWLIGYLGEADLAFAVLLLDGGSGGATAGPIAVDFLTGFQE
ncbi:penicillin-binding transpeptidase domain-containing protein [Streptomyces harbinensis]|uniref:penicillin-binding transpeptidase domain-containing protein n=1 Tax=Streptomyces harbinensis TaxID=1176198 RepID=UPI0036A6BB5F